jgi:hypothetical protein
MNEDYLTEIYLKVIARTSITSITPNSPLVADFNGGKAPAALSIKLSIVFKPSNPALSSGARVSTV